MRNSNSWKNLGSKEPPEVTCQRLFLKAKSYSDQDFQIKSRIFATDRFFQETYPNSVALFVKNLYTNWIYSEEACAYILFSCCHASSWREYLHPLFNLHSDIGKLRSSEPSYYKLEFSNLSLYTKLLIISAPYWSCAGLTPTSLFWTREIKIGHSIPSMS